MRCYYINITNAHNKRETKEESPEKAGGDFYQQSQDKNIVLVNLGF